MEFLLPRASGRGKSRETGDVRMVVVCWQRFSFQMCFVSEEVSPSEIRYVKEVFGGGIVERGQSFFFIKILVSRQHSSDLRGNIQNK